MTNNFLSRDSYSFVSLKLNWAAQKETIFNF